MLVVVVICLAIGIVIIGKIIEANDSNNTNETKKDYNSSNATTDNISDIVVKEIINTLGKDTKSTDKVDDLDEEDDIFGDNEENLKFECEVCFKKISEEEYELYDGMCEDCFYDAHLDDEGKFHDEEIY